MNLSGVLIYVLCLLLLMRERTREEEARVPYDIM